jgi:hypothetical protein
VRTWLIRGGVALLAVVLALGAVPAWRIGWLLRDDYMLDGITVAVALDWRDFGIDKAKQRLQYELDRAGLDAVRDDACKLDEAKDGPRKVACAWTMDLALPLWPRPIALSFASEASVDRNGVLAR